MRNFHFACVGTLTFGLLTTSGCSSLEPREAPGVDCSVADDYDLTPFRSFENLEMDYAADGFPWFAATDDTGMVPCDADNALPPAILEDGSVSPLCEPWVPCHYAEAIVPTELAALTREELAQVQCASIRRARASAGGEPIPESPRCGSENALHLTASGNKDWGNLFGDYLAATTTTDASAYDGVSFWARAMPGTTKTISLLLDDKYSLNLTFTDQEREALEQANPDDPDLEMACVDEAAEVLEEYGETVNVVTDQQGSTSVNVPGYVPSENACGNAYLKPIHLTYDWQFYVVPFSEFSQDPVPNRRIEGIDKASIRGVTIRAPKEALLDVWVDELSFYSVRK